MNKLAQRLTRSLKAPAAVQPIPYFAAYHLAAATLPPKALEALAGLLLGHIVRADDGSCRLFTYWSTAEHFHCGDAALRQRLAAAPLSGHGRIDSLCTPPVAWWRQLKPLTFVLSLFALFGAVKGLEGHFSWLFATPTLLLKPEKSKLEIIEGTDLSSTLTVVNQLISTDHRRVLVTAQFADRQGRSPDVQTDPREIPELAGGATREVVFTSAAPAAGQYTLTFNATAKAGWLRFASKQFTASTTVVVWPRLPKGSLHVMKYSGQWAIYSASIEVGPEAPLGLDCELQFKGIPGLQFNTLSLPELQSPEPHWQTTGEQSNAVAVLAWSTGKLKPRTRLTAQLRLDGEPGTDWTAVAASSQLTCRNRKE